MRTTSAKETGEGIVCSTRRRVANISDKFQNKWDMASTYAQDAMRMLNNVLDQAVLAEYSSAASSIDAGDVGGSAGSSISLSTSNVQQVFTALARELDNQDVPMQDRFAVIGSRTLETLRLYIGGKDTAAADVIGNNGLVTSRFGFDLYYSNNTPFSATWTPANQPSDGDTVTIAGVVFTFETGSLDTAGKVKSETSLEVTLNNLVAFVNNTHTDGTEGKEISSANRWILTKHGITMTDGATYVAITGYGDITVAASEVADPWSVQKSFLLAGRKGAIDLVTQIAPNVDFRLAEKRLGRYVYPWMLYGKKTFVDGTKQLCYATLDASSWT